MKQQRVGLNLRAFMLWSCAILTSKQCKRFTLQCISHELFTFSIFCPQTLEKHLAILKEVHYKQKKQIMHQHKTVCIYLCNSLCERTPIFTFSEVKQIGSEIITEVGLQSTPKSSTIDDRVTKFGTRMRRKVNPIIFCS